MKNKILIAPMMDWYDFNYYCLLSIGYRTAEVRGSKIIENSSRVDHNFHFGSKICCYQGKRPIISRRMSYGYED